MQARGQQSIGQISQRGAGEQTRRLQSDDFCFRGALPAPRPTETSRVDHQSLVSLNRDLDLSWLGHGLDVLCLAGGLVVNSGPSLAEASGRNRLDVRQNAPIGRSKSSEAAQKVLKSLSMRL